MPGSIHDWDDVSMLFSMTGIDDWDDYPLVIWQNYGKSIENRHFEERTTMENHHYPFSIRKNYGTSPFSIRTSASSLQIQLSTPQRPSPTAYTVHLPAVGLPELSLLAVHGVGVNAVHGVQRWQGALGHVGVMEDLSRNLSRNFNGILMGFLNGFHEISQAMRMNGLLGGSSHGLEVMIKKNLVRKSPKWVITFMYTYIYILYICIYIYIYCMCIYVYIYGV